jgi:signal transduction histidine kinase
MSQAPDNFENLAYLLTKINELLNSSLDSEALFKNIFSLIGFFFGVEHIFLVDLREEKNQLISTWNLSDKKNTGFQEYIQEIAYFEIKKQKFTYQFCIKNNPKLKNKFIKSKRYSCINIPIYTRQDFFGILILKTEQYTRTFSPAEIQTLECVAHQIAIALYQLQIQEREQTAAAEQPTDCAVLARREFFSHMTHELRTPLTGILGFSRLLQDEIYGTLNLKQKQYVNGIATSGEHLLSLVNDFLDLSKIEANREELYLETVAVEDICLAAMAIVQPRATEGRLTLHLEIDPDVDFCKVDQRRLKQILVNLLSNAIKFTEVGSVTLQVKRDQNLLKLSVIDTGIGINPEDQQKLFQPFQQIHNHLSRKHKGTGLGLLLSRKLAQLHGGDITLNSEKGKGSCFTVHIPIR